MKKVIISLTALFCLSNPFVSFAQTEEQLKQIRKEIYSDGAEESDICKEEKERAIATMLWYDKTLEIYFLISKQTINYMYIDVYQQELMLIESKKHKKDRRKISSTREGWLVEEIKNKRKEIDKTDKEIVKKQKEADDYYKYLEKKYP